MNLVALNPETAFPAIVTLVVAIGDAFGGKEKECQSSQYQNCGMEYQGVHFGTENEVKRTLDSVRWPLNCVVVKLVHHGRSQWIRKLGGEQGKSSLFVA